MSAEKLPQVLDPDAPVFSISVAAALSEMHPQTLRSYDRLGLVVPSRARGGGRRYTPNDVRRLRLIQHLGQDEGINLNGIRRIIELQAELDQTQRRLAEMSALARELADRRAEAGGRVFTAGASGVQRGRGYRRPLELPAR